jgi:molybdopterin-guanine dinucleotide biosynthesis protein MobB
VSGGRAPVLAFSGPSGSGKTRLLARLIPALAERGIRVAVVKHTAHAHPFDRPGKDTDVLRRAGAIAAAIEGPHGVALFAPPAGGLAALARLLPPVDLVLAEGWRSAPVPRVEVHRRAVSREFLCATDRRVVAVVTDEPPPRALPTFAPEDVAAIAAFVREWRARRRPGRGRGRAAAARRARPASGRRSRRG